MSETTPSVHPELARHQASMAPRIYSIRGSVHCAFGYSIANCTLIEGEDACILVDTLLGLDEARPVAEAFRAITAKPVRTIVYTHFHADHVSGAAAFISEEDVARGRVEIVGQEDLVGHVMRDAGLIAPIIGRRAIYQFGTRLPPGEAGVVGVGVGPPLNPGRPSFIAPTTTFREVHEGETGGVRFEVHRIPSETEDQCAVWLPDLRVLLSADAVYESFPNLYALRGTRFRDPMAWSRGLDRLKAFGAEVLVPHHGRPVEGAERVAGLLTDYRDAIQYVHDQTLRYMNKGYAPEEIAETVTMPERFRSHPWLGEYYGSFRHAIPAIYAGYLGWYEGDPVALDPTPRRQRAGRMADLMGGRERVMEVAQGALEGGDAQWAAELLTLLVRADPSDVEARRLKAAALRRWAWAQKNATWRNWGLTAALELEGEVELAGRGTGLGSPGQMRDYPLAAILQVMTVRLMAETCPEAQHCVAFEATDSGECGALEICRGVCRFHESPPAGCDARLRFDRQFLLDWVSGRTAFDEAAAAGRVSVEGDPAVVAAFLASFEPFDRTGGIAIAAR